MKKPIATIKMKNGAKIVIELDPEAAPNTVNSFISLAKKGCFNQYAIQRIVPGYVVDVSYSAFNREECKYLIANESPSHGFPNPISVEPGVIAMGGYENGIAGGEFFFPLAYHKKLDGNYPAFGRILEGWEEITRWEKADLISIPYPQNPEIEINEPKIPIVIDTVTIETFGNNFPDPVKLEMKDIPPSW